MSDKVYCYPNSDVLKNKLGIKDQDALFAAERDITSFHEANFKVNPVKGNLDFAHLQAIHKALFGDIYSWAGKLRTVDIGKGNTFCYSQFIQSYGDDIFRGLSRKNYFLDADRKTVMAGLAQLMGDLNALHPFREGNGRAQRSFLVSAAMVAGFSLHFSRADKDDMLLASKLSFVGDYSKFQNIFDHISDPLSIADQRDFLQSVSPKKISKLFDDMYAADKITDRLLESGGSPVIHSPPAVNGSRAMDDWKKDVQTLKAAHAMEEKSKSKTRSKDR